ncbi:MAG: type III-A CRISPR-associated protein Cas10/Csm1 [candidate division WOR-3 bacterium]
MNNDREFQTVVLAALLHDIGKFAQRTGVQPAGYEYFAEDDFGAHGAHSKWSAWFIENYLPDSFKAAGSPVLFHHRPCDRLSEIVARADRLSAGERIPDSGGAISQSRLVPILGRVYRPRWCENGFRLRPLSIRKADIFPLESQTSPDLTTEYRSLWQQFVQDVSVLRDKNPHFGPFLTSLTHILHRYTWCIPSAVYGSEPDISLYDHLKSSAAIAAALFASANPGTFRLIGGDIAGIQNFIYRLASPDEAQSGMAHRLRGRSFYVALLADTIALSVLEELGLPATNVLWCGGGNFAILAHDNAETDKLAARLENWLLEHFEGELGLALAHVDIDETGLVHFAESLDRLGFELQKAKQHKFASVVSYHQPFALAGDVCRVCGSDSTEALCAECARHKRIGQVIPRSSYLYRMPAAGMSTVDSVVEFSGLGVSWGFAQNLQDIPAGATEIYALNSTEMPVASVPAHVGCGFRFLGQQVPEDNRGTLTFEDLEKMCLGARFLGALRMDMDNLGKIFLFGLGENRTISRIAALSRSIDTFFSGFLNELASGYRTAYILYSGGDDAFVVASWNEAIAFAHQLQNELETYTCGNNHISISAGLHLFKHAFPIGIAARVAKEKLEGLAKGNKSNGREKNSLAVFEFPCFWPQACEALAFAEEIKKGIESKRLARRFVYNILGIYWTHFSDGREDIGWVPRFLYLLKRNVPAETEDGRPSELYAMLLARMPTMMRIAPLWANWVLLATRS